MSLRTGAHLILQTNLPGQLLVWIIAKDGKVIAQRSKHVSFHGSDQLLYLVDQTRQSKQLVWKSFQSIIVVRGPGPFTAVRTGIIVANTLATVLKIPVMGVTSDREIHPTSLGIKPKISNKRSLVRPAYGREPNISKPKKH